MPSQASLAKQVLAKSTAIILKLSDDDGAMPTDDSQQRILEDISQVFHGRLEVLPDIHDTTKENGIQISLPLLEQAAHQFLDSVKRSNQYFVFVLLSSSNTDNTNTDTDTDTENIINTVAHALLRHKCPGCTILLSQSSTIVTTTAAAAAQKVHNGKCGNEKKTASLHYYDKSWFVRELTRETELHLSWKILMKDELMDDDEYQEEIFEAVIEELDMISTVPLPSQWNFQQQKWSDDDLQLEYLDRVWKLSHSYKTTATLVGGVRLGEIASTVCEMLRPVVRCGVSTKTLDLQETFDSIAQFLMAASTLRFVIQLLAEKK